MPATAVAHRSGEGIVADQRRVEHRIADRQHLARAVVVADDDVEPKVVGAWATASTAVIPQSTAISMSRAALGKSFDLARAGARTRS